MYADTSRKDIKNIVDEVDLSLMLSIDASDNGVSIYTSDYILTTLSKVLSMFNPEDISDLDVVTTGFEKALDLATTILIKHVSGSKKIIEAREKLDIDLKLRKHKNILVLEEPYSWKKALVESEYGKDILFVICKDSINNNYRIQTVPVNMQTTAAKVEFPKEWWGKSTGNLCKAANISDGIFCHPTGFMMLVTSRESAVKLTSDIIRKRK